MNKYLKISLIIVFLIAVGVIIFTLIPNSVKKLINKKFPPLSYTDQRNVSLQQNQIALNAITSPDFLVNIGAKDFSHLFDSAMTRFLKSKKLIIPHISKYQFDAMKTSTDKQLINISMNFKLELDTMNAKLAGNFSGVLTFAVRHDSLIFFPALKSLHLDNLTFQKVNKTDKNVLVSFFNTTLKNFINNINGLINSKTRGIDINLTHKNINTKNLPNNDSISITLSKPIEISLPILLGACMIDESGLHICGSYDYGDFAGLNLKHIEITESFDGDFRKFKDEFYKKNKSAFPNDLASEKTFFLVQKKSLASIINRTLSGEVITGLYNKEVNLKPIDKEIIIKSSDVDCDKINFQCPEVKILPPCGNPPVGDCNFNCKAYLPNYLECRGLEEACKLTFKGKLSLWNLACEAFEESIQHSLEAKATCLSVKAPAVTTCLGIKAYINSVGGTVNLGSVKVDTRSHLKLNAELKEIEVSDNLSSLKFLLKSSANVSTHLNFRLQSKNEGKIICPFKVQHLIEPIGIAQSDNSVTTKIMFSEQDNDQIIMAFEVGSFPIEALLSPTPLTEIDNLTNSFMSCPIVFPALKGIPASLNVIKGFRDIFNKGDGDDIQNLIFDGKYSLDTPSYPIKLSIQIKPIVLFGNSIKLKPLLNDTYFGFANR